MSTVILSGSWHDKPIPRRWHRCRADMLGLDTAIGRVERCACGSIRLNRGHWMERNSRRKAKR